MIIEVRVVCGWHCHRVYMMCASCECIHCYVRHTHYTHTLYYSSTRDDSDDDSIARYTPRSLSTAVLAIVLIIRRYHIRSILYNYDYRSACRVWLTLSSCLHDVRVYCYVRHTHYTHCTTCDDSDDDNIELQLDLFCILTYELSIPLSPFGPCPGFSQPNFRILRGCPTWTST